MYAAIRQGKAKAGKAEELTRRIKEGAVPVISGVDGFMGYYVVYAPDDTVIAISLFNNFAAAEESNKRALAWIEHDLAPLLLRPREFIANARDLVTLKAAVAEQAPRYAEIKAPVTIITGEADKTVSTNIHSRPFAATAPNAKLIVLPGVGHMIQQAAPDLVIAEVEAMLSGTAPGAEAAAAH